MSNTRTPAAKKAASKKKGLRSALDRRKSRKDYYDIPLVESEEVAEKAGRVRNLAVLVENVRVMDRDPAALQRSEQALADAKTDLAECFQRLWFQGLPEDQYDELLNEHPPTDEQVAEAKKDGEEVPTFNPKTFFPALLNKCYVGDDGLTAEEWAAELEQWSRAEKNAITQTVIAVNTRAFSDGIPKD